MLERGEITRAQVLLGRFQVLLEELGHEDKESAIAIALRDTYEENLSHGHWFVEGAERLLEDLKDKYRLFLCSNGTAKVQKGRLESSGIAPYFEKIFVSEAIGHNKPSKAYFDACFASIPDFDIEKAIIVGDSLTSDIRGGINAGLKTIWVNPEHKPCGDIVPDYEIETLSQLEALLEEING